MNIYSNRTIFRELDDVIVVSLFFMLRYKYNLDNVLLISSDKYSGPSLRTENLGNGIILLLFNDDSIFNFNNLISKLFNYLTAANVGAASAASAASAAGAAGAADAADAAAVSVPAFLPQLIIKLKKIKPTVDKLRGDEFKFSFIISELFFPYFRFYMNNTPDRKSQEQSFEERKATIKRMQDEQKRKSKLKELDTEETTAKANLNLPIIKSLNTRIDDVNTRPYYGYDNKEERFRKYLKNADNSNMTQEQIFYKKYLLYKKKYLSLKKMLM
jgi:hypothetical protein